MCTLYYLIVLENDKPVFKIGTMTQKEVAKIRKWYSEDINHNYTFAYKQEEYPEIK